MAVDGSELLVVEVVVVAERVVVVFFGCVFW